MENANVSLIALKANVPPSLQSRLKPRPLHVYTLADQNNRDKITTVGYISGSQFQSSQRSECKEHVSRNTVHARSALLTS